ncbi:MAG TPA: hypothetical protein ENK38_05155 [Gammaproteobacteria bacterium]|nr:hypothetical protein [Gammaproteobacteria bacterium]
MPVVNCTFCNAEFKRLPYLIRKHGNGFCSMNCYASYQRTGYIDNKGYSRIGFGGKSFLEHRLVIEKSLGRKLLSTEIIHHIDGDKLNNSLCNLEVTNRVDHQRHHRPLSWDVETAKALRNEGLTFDKIGERLGVVRTAICNYFRENGIDSSRKTINKATVAELFSEGLSGYEIGRRLGCSGVQANRIIKKLGLR